MAEKKEKKIIDADTGLEVKAGSKKKPVSSTGAPMHEAPRWATPKGFASARSFCG